MAFLLSIVQKICQVGYRTLGKSLQPAERGFELLLYTSGFGPRRIVRYKPAMVFGMLGSFYCKA